MTSTHQGSEALVLLFREQVTPPGPQLSKFRSEPPLVQQSASDGFLSNTDAVVKDVFRAETLEEILAELPRKLRTRGKSSPARIRCISDTIQSEPCRLGATLRPGTSQFLAALATLEHF